MEDFSTSDNIQNLSKIKRSLIISPNLDALLEHEERTRTQTPSGFKMTTSSRSVSPSEELPAGLPPPPRHPRRVNKPRSTSSLKSNLLVSADNSEIQIQEKPTPASMKPTSSSASNPYINPAPTLAELLVDMPSKVSVTTNSSINSLSQPRPYDHEQPSTHRSDSRDGSPITTASPRSPFNSSGDHFGQQSRSPPSHVAKLLRVDLSPYNNLLNPEDRQRQSRTTKAVSPGLLHVHNKGKSEDMRGRDSQIQALSDSDPPVHSDSKPCRRHSISLAKCPSSTPSSTYTLSFSSHEPATTTENESRVNISSTDPPSPRHSHSHLLYNDPVLSLTKNKQNRDSHMETYSPSNTKFNLDSPSTKCPQLSPIQFSKISFSEHSPLLISPEASPRSSKPPLPTTPKPVFYRAPMKPGFSRQVFPILETSGAPLPPTTNFLDAKERTNLVWKTRKLARVFGQTPRADATARQEKSAQDPSPPVLNDSGLRRPGSALELEASLLNGGRRHSVPFGPEDMPFMANVSPKFVRHLSPSSYQAGQDAQVQIRSEPPSFINLSADSFDGGDIAVVIPEADSISRSLPSSPTQSQFEKMFEKEQADEDRKRKRERLAKLHRFLGSSVPVNLVLGIDDVEASLPPPNRSPTSPSLGSADSRKTFLKLRRSSSADLLCSHWVNDIERVKEELDDKEKFINVRRAIKMEKVFGVAPPQTLYHTRQGPPPLLLASKSEVRTIPSPTVSTSPLQSNLNHPPYIKYKSKKNNRPGTSDSNTKLLPKGEQTFNGLDSTIYNHYQYSLNSLHDILDRDDKESLLELHQYLNAGENPPEVSTVGHKPNASSIKSGRRRSLPTTPRASMISLDSEYSLTTPEPDIATFQLRRRRAAKLTQFFGVDYRELISDILQSIENGVEHENENGTLRAEEVEDLLKILRSLKAKRQSFL